MTREQAIEHGKSQLEVFGGQHREFIELAIKALEQEQEIEKIYQHWMKDWGYTTNEAWHDVTAVVIAESEEV